jgi:two-component system sensor histidine kinase/response regulator
MDTAKARILIVDDEALVLDSCRRVLAEAGYAVDTASDGGEAIRKLSDSQYDLMLVDLKMPDMDGLQVLHRARQKDPEMVVAIITGYGTVETAVEAMKNGAYDYISKPISASSLEMLAKRALETARLQKELARIEREKENFIQTVYHEFKAPVADISIFLSTLGRTLKLNDRQMHTLSLCRKRLVPLRELTEDLLQITKAEHMQRQKRLASVDLLQIAKSALSSNSALAAEAGVALELDPASESISVTTERESITTVLNNLIRNGIRYNKPEGSVTLKTGRGDGSAWIRVADTGIGIAQEHQPLIFEEFYRVRNETTKDVCGTGLGLSIVKRVLDSLGGRIVLESEPGKGSVFTVYLPV